MPVTSANIVAGAGSIACSPRDTTPSTFTAVASPSPTTTTFSVLIAGLGDLKVGDRLGLASATPTWLAAEASTAPVVQSITLNGANYDVVVSPAFGSAPPSTAAGVRRLWIDLGATDGGIEMNINKDVVELFVDQSLAPVGTVDSKLEVTFKAPLAELTLKNAARAAGVPDPASATVLQINANASTRTDRYLITCPAPGGKTRYAVVHKAKAFGELSQMAKKTDKGIFQLEVKAFQDTTMTPDLVDILDV